MKGMCIKYMANWLFLENTVPKFAATLQITKKRINLPCFKKQHTSASQLEKELCELNKVFIKGWVKEVEMLKKFVIIGVNDGLSRINTKVVLPESLYSPKINIGAPVLITGENNKEKEEITATKIEVKGNPYNSDKGLKKTLSFNGLRGELCNSLKEIQNFEHKHLLHPRYRSRFEFFNSRFRVRSKLKSYLHQYFIERDYIEIDSPILTRYLRDAEHKTYYVESTVRREDVPFDNPVNSFFGHPVYLSTCRRHHLECVASGLNKVYSIGPLFRGGISSGKYLYEFWRADCEEIFSENKNVAFENLLISVENLIKQMIKYIMDNSKLDAELGEGAVELLKSVLEKKWMKIPYEEAVSILQTKEKEVGYMVHYGTFLARKSQTVLLDTFNNCPLFITDYPYYSKSFNVALKENETSNVLAFDLILPETGTTASGSVKEKDFSLLQERLQEYGAEEYYSWFSEIHKWGVAPTMGFSIGIERLLYLLFKDVNIKNVVPFPRYFTSCDC